MDIREQIAAAISMWSMNEDAWVSRLADEIMLLVDAAAPEEIEEAAQAIRRASGGGCVVYSVPVEIWRELTI